MKNEGTVPSAESTGSWFYGLTRVVASKPRRSNKAFFVPVDEVFLEAMSRRPSAAEVESSVSSVVMVQPSSSDNSSASDEEELDLKITQKLMDLERHYFEKHQQEEQDKQFALQLQREMDKQDKLQESKEDRCLRPRQNLNQPPPDFSLSKENSTDKDL